MKHKKMKTGKSRSRPKKKSNRDERKILITLKLVRKTDGGNFTSKKIQYLSRINKASPRKVRNVLNKNGYAFRRTRRKRNFVGKGSPKRSQYAKKVVKFFEPTFWTNGMFLFEWLKNMYKNYTLKTKQGLEFGSEKIKV